MTATEAVEEYARRHAEFLERVAAKLETHLKSCLAGTPNIDRIAARAKAPSRFAEKVGRTDENDVPKYKAPLTEIQDLVGARVIVFYRDDVATVAGVIRRYFRPIEERELVPESHWTFGYFGEHFVLALPGDVIPAGVEANRVPRFFELQIKTLFQHAWSEANHDLGYKGPKELSPDQQRRLAYTAAQAWGADRVFSELRGELLPPAGGTS